MSDSLRPLRLQPARLLCTWDSPDKNTGVGCHFLLQGIFPKQGSNPCLFCLLHCQAGSLLLAPSGKPWITLYLFKLVDIELDRNWNLRSMNQGKLEVVKQEMARVNIHILGITILRWTGMGEFNSDDHYIYYCGQQSHRRNEVAFIGNNRVWNTVLGCNLPSDKMISVRFQSKPFNIMVIQVKVPTSNAEEAEVEQFYEDLQDLLELTP